MRSLVMASFCATLLASGVACAQDVPAAAGEPALGARLEVRAAGAARYVVNLAHAGGTAQCETPCVVDVVPGDVRLTASGAASFEQVLSVGGPAAVTLHSRSDLLFFGGLIAAAVGVAGVITALALNPAEGSNDVWAASLGIGGIVCAGAGFTAVANAGSAGAELEATSAAARAPRRLHFIAGPSMGGFAVAGGIAF